MDKKIIGLLGFKGSGKDTVADYLCKKEGYIKLSFSGAVKDICSILFYWDRKLLEGSTDESRKWREKVDPYWSKKLNIKNFTPRYALQYVGTNLFRDHLHKDIWLHLVEKKLLDTDADKIVISDVRFKNEIEALNNLEAELYEINRGELPSWYSTAIFLNNLEDEEIIEGYMEIYADIADVHRSEWDWVGTNVAGTIFNNGTKEHLYKEVDRIILNKI
jgi:hypothetical protein